MPHIDTVNKYHWSGESKDLALRSASAVLYHSSVSETMVRYAKHNQ